MSQSHQPRRDRRKPSTFVILTQSTAILLQLVALTHLVRSLLEEGPSVWPEVPLLVTLLSGSCLLVLGQGLYHHYRAKRWHRALGTATARSAEINVLLTSIAENSTDAIFAKDIDGRYQIFNPAAERLFTKSAESIIGKKDEELFAHELAMHFISTDKRVLASGQSSTYEEEIVFDDGKRRTMLTTKSPMRNKQGAILGVCGISTDITERKNTENRLSESERKFSSFFYGSPVSKFILDLNTKQFVAVNGTLCSFFGRQIEEVVGKSPYDLGMLVEDDSVLELRKALKDTGRLKGIELKIRRPDGEIQLAACYAETVVRNDSRLLMGSVIDISEQKRFEEELLASRMRYLSLFEHMLAAVAYCQVREHEGKEDLFVLETNPHFEQVSGLNPLYVTDRPLREVMPDLYRTNPEIFERCMSAANSGISSRFEAWVPSLSRWLQFSVCGLGKGFFVMLFDDITERKRNETEVLRLNEKLNNQVTSQKKQLSDAVGDMETFVYSVSTLLQDSLTEMTKQLTPFNFPANQPVQVSRETVTQLVDTTTKMGRLLEGAVSYLCGTALPFEPEFIDMVNVINPVLADVKTRYPAVEFDLHGMPRVIGSAVILRTIYTVLLDNAARYAMKGSRPPRVTLGASHLEMETVFYVEDTGPGIVEDRMEALFTPFSQVNEPSGGTSVGLALARRMVERHGGRIWALPTGDGCVFQFTLGPLEIEHVSSPIAATATIQ